MPALLRQLIDVRSRLEDEAIRFLEASADTIDWTPWECGGRPLRAGSAFVEPIVLLERQRYWEPDPRADSKSGKPKSVEENFGIDKLIAHLYEHERFSKKHEEKRWGHVLRPGSRLRLVVTGEPGGGKTCATRHTAANLARQGAVRLRRRTASVAEIIFPIWVTAHHLAAQPPDLETPEAVIRAFEEERSRSAKPLSCFRRWLLTQIERSNTLIIIDALDELTIKLPHLREKKAGVLPSGVSVDQRERFACWIAELDELQASLVVTCRTLSWRRLISFVRWQSSHDTVELKPLDSRAQRQFARAFFDFTGRTELAKSLEKRLAQNRSLREYARTPLILTLACILFSEGRPHDFTVPALYGMFTGALLEGRWRKSAVLPEWSADVELWSEVQGFLPSLAWHLFRPRQGLLKTKMSDAGQVLNSNRFTATAWNVAYDDATADGHRCFLDSTTLRGGLVDLGVLVSGGVNEARFPCWSFAHRTLLEFLAADGLKARLDSDEATYRWLLEEQKPIEQNPFWFQLDWVPVLTFLAALLEDATVLLQAIDVPPLVDGQPVAGDDFFQQMFGLKCRLAGAAPKTPIKIVEPLVDRWLLAWDASLQGPFQGMQSVLEDYVSALAGNPAFVALVDERLFPRLSWDPEYGERYFVQHLIASVLKGIPFGEIGDVFGATIGVLTRIEAPGIAARAKQFLNASFWHTRWKAAEALEALGDAAAIGALNERLAREDQRIVYRANCRALISLGDTSLVDRLNHSIEKAGPDDDTWHAADALGELGEPRAAATLAALLAARAEAIDQGNLDGSRKMTEVELESLGWELAVPLGKLGDQRAYPYLVRTLNSTIGLYRADAATALEKLGDRRAIKPLLAALKTEPRESTADAIASALRALGGPQIVDELIIALQDKDGSVSWPGDRPLHRPGQEEFKRELVSQMRSFAARTLGIMGDSRAIAILRRYLMREADPAVRGAIAEALGALRDPGAIKDLAFCLTREQVPETRGKIAAALEALASHPDAPEFSRKAKEALRERLKNERDSVVCRSIVSALASFGDREAAVAMRQLLYFPVQSESRTSITAGLWRLCVAEKIYLPSPPMRRCSWADRIAVPIAKGVITAIRMIHKIQAPWRDPR
jgi:HEAT repeat protein